MSPTIRFITAVFLAQTFVNAVAVPNPHIHRVLDARQAAALPVVARQETVEPDAKNVFDAIIDTLEGYNGWQVFQDFFRKLFAGPDEDSDDGAEVTPPVIIVPGPSSSPVDVISVIESIISEVAETTPVVVIPTEVPVVSESDGIMSILPIFPVTTAVDLSFTGEPAVPTELLPETTEIPVIVLPSYGPSETDVVVTLPTEIVPSVGTEPIVILPVPTESVALPAENGTIVASLPGTEPVVIVIPTDLPVEANTTATEAPVVVVIPTDLPVEANVTAPGTEPVVVVIPTDLPVEANTTATEVPVIVIPTDISSPVEINGTASAGAEVNVTISATVIVAPIATGTDVGTILPITISSEEAPFANTTDVITPTLIIVTGTGEPVATIEPTISAPFANDTEATAAPVETSAIIIGSGVVAPSGTEVVISVEPIETIIIETAPIVTGTGDVTAVVPIGTALPLFPNGTEVVVEPTIVVPDGTAPVVSAVPLPSPIDEPSFANTTTTTVTNVITPSADIETAVETPQAPAGTIVVVPGPDVVFPNVTITVNGSEATLPVTLPTLDVDATEAPVVTIDIGTLAPALSIGTEFPAIPIVTVDESVIASATFVPIDTLLPVVTDLPIIPVDTALPIGTDLPVIPVIPVIPIDTLLPVVPVDTALPTEIVPIDTLLPVVPVETVEPIPTDAPVVEFPGEPIIPTFPTDIILPAPEETAPIFIDPILPVESVTPVETAPVVDATILPIDLGTPVPLPSPISVEFPEDATILPIALGTPVPFPLGTPVPFPSPISVEFPDEPVPEVSATVIPVIPVVPVESIEPVVEEPSTTIVIPVPAETLNVEPTPPVAAEASVAASAEVSAEASVAVDASIASPATPTATPTTLIAVVAAPAEPTVVPFPGARAQ